MSLLQETVPLYKKLEKKIELLNEFVQVTDEMSKAIASSPPVLSAQGVSFSDLHSTLVHLREDFDLKNRHWGPILTSKARFNDDVLHS